MKSLSSQMAASVLLALWVKQTDAFYVGQEVCVSGYITCLDCNVGKMLPYNTAYNMFQSVSHPEDHNLQCLVENESCMSDGYEILTRYAIENVENKDETNEVYCRSFQLDSNSSSFIADAGVAYFQADQAIVQIGGFPVSFTGQITNVGDSHSSLATVAIDKDTLSLSMGGCANENVPNYCISRSGSYQFIEDPPTEAPTTTSPTKSPVTKYFAANAPSSLFITDKYVTSSLGSEVSGDASNDAFAATEENSDTLVDETEYDFMMSMSMSMSMQLDDTSPSSTLPQIDSTSATEKTDTSITEPENSVVDDTPSGDSDIQKVTQSQHATFIDKEMEIKHLFKNHGILAGVSWGIVIPLAMSTAWFRESFPVNKGNCKNSCGQTLFHQAWLILHISMASIAAVATSVSIYFVVKALSMEGGMEYAMTFSTPHQYMGIFLLVGVWAQVLGGIFRPKHKYTAHAKMVDREDEENRSEIRDDFSDSITVDSTSSIMIQGGLVHKWNKFANSSIEVVKEKDTVLTTPKTYARKIWDFGHRLLALTLVICGFWQLFSGLGVYQARYGDDSKLVTACMVWVGVFWSMTVVLTCFFKKF